MWQCVATFIGTYIPGKLIKKSEKDRLYIFDIAGDTFETSVKLSDLIKKNNIAVRTEIAYNEKVEKILICKVYCSTKNDSSIVNGILNSSEFEGKVKWHIYSPIEEGN